LADTSDFPLLVAFFAKNQNGAKKEVKKVWVGWF
jgi:hypothetical protein